MPQRILLIDDSRSDHALAESQLVGPLAEMHSAYTGEQGLEAAARLQPDLILLDLDMQQPQGIEICRLLKANSRTLEIPVLLLCQQGSTEKHEALELGAVDYITKPINSADLRARVRGALRTKYLMDLLGKRSRIDGLSGLWNRDYFDDRVEQELSLARRAARPISCILVNIDNFGDMNRECGFPFGDDVIRLVANAMTHVARLEDVICRRRGGEYYIALCPNTSICGAEMLAVRLGAAITGLTMRHEERVVRVSCCFGIAADAGDAESIVATAEHALASAKNLGRDRIVVADAHSTIIAH